MSAPFAQTYLSETLGSLRYLSILDLSGFVLALKSLRTIYEKANLKILKQKIYYWKKALQLQIIFRFTW